MPRFKTYKYAEWAQLVFDRFCADAPNVVAVDTETSGFAWDDEAFCVTMSWRPAGPSRAHELMSCYLDLQFDDEGRRHDMVEHMLKRTPTWVFHNAKFDLQKLALADVLPPNYSTWARVEDTNIIHALLDENDRHGLKYLAKKLLGEDTNEDAVLAKVRRKLKIKKDEGYHLLPREVVVPYAMKDTEFTLRLYELLRPKLPDELAPLYDAELDTMSAVLSIEGNGIGVDVERTRAEASRLGVELMKLDAKLQELTADTTVPEKQRAVFNPNSPKQITEAFARRGVKVTATDKATLGTLDDELASTLLEYRHKKKLHSTYLVPLLAEQHDGIIHPNFNLTLPRTGRMSSSAASNN